MYTKPSIVLEGAPNAADWLPFATSMLRSMTSDGSANYTPEEGITIVISRYGSTSKILIRAEYPEGFRFAGKPYDTQHTSGWGAPYSDDNPKGTPGSHENSDVILENSQGGWQAYRYPDYEADYSKLEYGNLDWTSADGTTVVTWDGANSPHRSEGAYTGELSGICCTTITPANNWHVGYYYPGFKIINSANCGLIPYTPQSIDFVDSQEPTSFYSEDIVNSNIYMNGELLLRAKVPLGVYPSPEVEKDMQVFGAAIQQVTEVDGSITKYLVAVLGGYSDLPSSSTSIKEQYEYLYRAPLSDVESYVLTRIESSPGLFIQADMSDLSPWCFNSTGNKAVALRDITSQNVIEISIADDGTVTEQTLWDYSNGAPVKTQVGYHSPLSPGDTDRWDSRGAVVVAVGYKNDKVRYGVRYSIEWQEKGITLDNPAVGCDTIHYQLDNDIKAWFVFADYPGDVTEQTVGGKYIHSEHVTFKESKLGGTVGTYLDPALLVEFGNEKEMYHPLYIDCRYDMVVYQHTTEVYNRFKYGVLGDGSAAYPIPEYNYPDRYDYSISLEMYIEGNQVYTSNSFIQSRKPGECHPDYTFSAITPYACDQTGYLLYLSGGDQNNASYSLSTYLEFGSYDVVSFCNIQIHKQDPDKADFDILFTARTKFSDPEAFADSFVAHWNGTELTEISTIETLLGLGENGILANTGKI